MMLLNVLLLLNVYSIHGLSFSKENNFPESFFLLFRITGEPLFSNTGDGLLYSDQFGYGNNNEDSSSTLEPGAVGFDFRSHANDLDRFLSATIGHPQILQNVADYNPDESDDMSDEYEDMDEEDASNGDESSPGELDE